MPNPNIPAPIICKTPLPKQGTKCTPIHNLKLTEINEPNRQETGKNFREKYFEKVTNPLKPTS